MISQDPSLAVEMKNWEPRLGIAEDVGERNNPPDREETRYEN